MENKTNLIITIDVFSGRPNPSFKLIEVEEINNITQQIKMLTDRDKLQPTFMDNVSHLSKLGYRGVIIHDNMGLIWGTPRKYYISKGYVIYKEDNKYLVFNDVECSFEKYILGIAKEKRIITEGMSELLPNRVK
ncbi:MAG: hypothetical protein A2487_02815 [Candidatus Raymondbacteria bacterium RifOxyC12_full_50_8]|uniref:Uncharacterized protein n=1 Tax=Candidatus Raymondbacteria bacterium RIFOXYD12_FULL_49_13 TaxID=1817890 RepID=A0A1F7F6I8_UNCRA|nr:MAG: hypothetical protein A2350_07025 [Candidatus Raymondbacteria bacterium RifOxyB12_full_50_8]OGJ93176.1 MAG: hypothetical protein A2248_17540 [Candidatus Raymondbacteria bacterium RIFOXYA2_FULL_49_16]OGJ93374.1 MAG: hypothetical protein A2487_02815 [Candidatus Raymondbacteria bacterium RifOxyC12_full_50_8]OGK02284.1 MAG: hypothetical protein A2519_16560 [Candidatus Raymondbacteria bacterium RIFOXYD12_FULL_49_13]OGP44898.1 MAG: hypothetical protein A2324_19465 [Candidatus Raymondbacteria b